MTGKENISLELDEELLNADRVLDVLRRAIASESQGMSRIAMSQAAESIHQLSAAVRSRHLPALEIQGEMVEVGNLEGGDIRGLTIRRGNEFVSVTGLSVEETISAANFYGSDITIIVRRNDQEVRQAELFCDSNCVWTNHHPDCPYEGDKTIVAKLPWAQDENHLYYTEGETAYDVRVSMIDGPGARSSKSTELATRLHVLLSNFANKL